MFVNQYLSTIGCTVPLLESEYYPNTHCQRLAGTLLATKLLDQVSHLFVQGAFPAPHLAVVLVGDDPASKIYVSHKIQTFERLKFRSTLYPLKADCGLLEIKKLIDLLNRDPLVHGILVQLPLPNFYDSYDVIQSIDPCKDVDGLHAVNAGTVALGGVRGRFFAPCTPLGVLALLQAYSIPLASQHVVVLGRSLIVGKPMSLMGLASDATVTVAHSKTKNLASLCSQADVLVLATGVLGVVDLRTLKPGVVIVDVGIHRLATGKLCGDVGIHPEGLLGSVAALTPVPGGVGPLTVAMLVLNTVRAVSFQSGIFPF